jgi:outer membrane protein assembly factor BamB
MDFFMWARWREVLRAQHGDGKLVTTIDCGEPIFTAPVVGNGRVYMATLGSRVYALNPTEPSAGSGIM